MNFYQKLISYWNGIQIKIDMFHVNWDFPKIIFWWHRSECYTTVRVILSNNNVSMLEIVKFISIFTSFMNYWYNRRICVQNTMVGFGGWLDSSLYCTHTKLIYLFNKMETSEVVQLIDILSFYWTSNVFFKYLKWVKELIFREINSNSIISSLNCAAALT